MSDTLARSVREAQYIYQNAPLYDQRSGQFLFNSLRHEIADKVRGTKLDPFYKDLQLWEIVEWLEYHIIYNDQGIMVCLFDGENLLWEEGND